MMLIEKWLWSTGCWGRKLHPQFTNRRKRGPNTQGKKGDGGDAKDAQVPERGCENHKLLFQTCQEAKRQALMVHSPGAHLGLKAGMFPPLHSSLPRGQLYCPPPPDHPWGQWMQGSPLPGLRFLLLYRTQAAVTPCMDDFSKYKEHETYSNTPRNGRGCFSVVTKWLDSQQQWKKFCA